MERKTYNYCIVPQCPTTSVTAPEKIFITLPRNKMERKLWQKAMRRSDFVGDKTKAVVCEDHFNLEEDMENYMYFKLMKNVHIKIKRGVLPHIFDCQTDREDTHILRHRSCRTLKKILDKPSLLSLDTKKLRESEIEDLEEAGNNQKLHIFKQVHKYVQINIKPNMKSKGTQCNLVEIRKNEPQIQNLKSSDFSKVSLSSTSYSVICMK